MKKKAMSESSQSLQILHYERRPRSHGNFSIESIFQDVRARLNPRIAIANRQAPFLSNGFIRRIAIVLDAWWNQLAITHVTGDIHFAVLGVRKKRAVLTVHDCGFIRSGGLRSQILKKFWLDWPVAHATLITTVSHFMKQEIIQRTGCAESKIVVIPNAVSSLYSPSPRNFDATRPRILVVGTSSNKNVYRIVNACRGIQCRLVIIGRLSSDLVTLLETLCIDYENPVNLSDNEIVTQYQLSDIVCFPSTYEGFGIPILEGQATGRPVITSNCGPMPEVAGDGACLVDPLAEQSIREGLIQIITDPIYRQQLVDFGFENVKRYSPENVATQYLHVYERLFSSTA